MTAAKPSSLPLPRTHGDDLPPLPARLIWRELAAIWMVALVALATLWLG